MSRSSSGIVTRQSRPLTGAMVHARARTFDQWPREPAGSGLLGVGGFQPLRRSLEIGFDLLDVRRELHVLWRFAAVAQHDLPNLSTDRGRGALKGLLPTDVAAVDPSVRHRCLLYTSD